MLTSPSPYPFLATDAGPLRWSDGARLNELHRALWVEVAPRGIRFVDTGAKAHFYVGHHPLQCEAVAPDALCETDNATLFVSADFGVGDDDAKKKKIQVPLASSDSHDVVARAYIDQTTDACADNGVGRTLLESAPRMIVSACDVMDGHLVALWDVGDGGVYLTGQTFGPMAYAAMLLQAAACLYLATLSRPPQATSAVVIGLVAGCASAAVRGKLRFVMEDDARFFWCIGAWALCLAVSGWCMDDAAQRGEACLQALSMLACAVHRTPENAYAGLLALVLAVRFWDKVLRWERWLYPSSSSSYNYYYYYQQRDAAASVALANNDDEQKKNEEEKAPVGLCALVYGLDCLVSAPILLGGARIGLAPSFVASSARWPLFAGTGLYICFVFAMHRRARSSLIGSSSSSSGSG